MSLEPTSPGPAKLLLSWSSGKDSAWALHVLRARTDVKVVGLLTTLNETHDRVSMHAVRRGLLEAQAAAVGLPLTIVPIPSPCSNDVYGAAMARALDAARRAGVTGVAFGDLFLEDVRRYREEQMQAAGLTPYFPLWGRPTAALAEELIAAGMRARIVCVDARVLPPAWAGRELDRGLIAELPAGVDPCGEHGEFHTFAWDGPMFRRPVPVRHAGTVVRDGFAFADLLPAEERDTRTAAEPERATAGARMPAPDPLAPNGRASRRARRAPRRVAGVLSALIALGAVVQAAAAGAPQRVASANLAADEVLSAILPPERLVSVTRWADDESMSNIVGRVPRSVFRVQKADLESLMALRPDLVVVSEYTDADLQQLLERSGMRVHRMGGLVTLEGVREAMLALGRAVGAERGAAELVRRYDARLAELRRRLQGAPRTRVLYWADGMTAGADTAIGALIEAAGAVNVGRELGLKSIEPPGSERAFAADPDVVLVSDWPGAEAAVRQHPLLRELRAVKQGRVRAMPNRLLVTLSQFSADAAWRLASILHPERVAPASSDPTP